MNKTFLFIALFVMPMALAQSIDVSSAGTCKNYEISVRANVAGCWDVKIDAPGHIIVENKEKDTFFYVNNALCNSRADMQLKLSTANDINAVLKLRQNSTILEKDFIIDQNCPEELSTENIFAVAIIIILILLGSTVWYVRRR